MENTRIDKGIKRKEQDVIPDIVVRYSQGTGTDELAKEHGVSRQTIYNWMFSALGDKQYHQIITEAFVRRISDADFRLETAANALELARAREMARFARQDLERRRPELYGQKQEVTHKLPEPLRIVVSAPQIAVQHDNSGVVVEPESVQVIDNK